VVNVRFIERRGAVLTPSGLACLAGVPTVNISTGCAHGCVYCYGRGYSQYPGEDVVLVYRDTAERIGKELARKRRRPVAVYFCPSCDAFQPLDAVLEQSYQSMATILDAGVGVEFVTKGAVPPRFLDLFSRHPGCVSGQVGLTTLDEGLRTILEPGAASVAERLCGISRLKDGGVSISVRADPLIHGVTDSDSSLAALMAACRERGGTDVAASYLFLRPAIVASLKRHVADRALVERVLAPYADGVRFALRGGAGGGLALPEAIRRAGFERLKQLAAEHGLHIHVCGCKNPDVASGRCHLVRDRAAAKTGHRSQGSTGLLRKTHPCSDCP
jgi:DNA repair photolyase